MTRNTFGTNIALFRTKAGMTQSALAERIGVSAQAISKWETGAGYPDAETIPLLARQLGTTTDSLFGIEEEEAAHTALVSESWKEEIIDAVRNEIAEILSELQGTVESAVEEALSGYDGGNGDAETRQTIMVLSPDKSKLLRCIGGLRIPDPSDVLNCPPDRFMLMVQTQRDAWEMLCWFSDREEAQKALCRIGEAMRRGESEISL